MTKQTNILQVQLGTLTLDNPVIPASGTFGFGEAYEDLKDSYVLDKEKMKLASKEMAVLHPLPRVNEIAVEVDDDPRAAYFRQVKNGKFIRMALILKMLGDIERVEV